jgi:hypothetical protein
MPRYFFHMFNDDTTTDEEGQELPSDAAALQRAAEYARAMAADSVSLGHLVLDHRIVVEKDAGERVGAIHFRDVVKIKEHE